MKLLLAIMWTINVVITTYTGYAYGEGPRWTTILLQAATAILCWIVYFKQTSDDDFKREAEEFDKDLDRYLGGKRQ